MKKLAILAVTALFVVMTAAAAFSAETTFNGQYRIRAYSEWNFDKAVGYGPGYGNDVNRQQYDGWFEQRFRLTITHKRSEFLKAVVRLDLVEDTWGQGRAFRINNSIDGNYVDWAYLEFSLPKIGTFTVGKQPVTFGYGLLFSTGGSYPGVDGIKWANTWGPVTVAAMYLKINDNVSMGSFGANAKYYNRDSNMWALDVKIAPNDKHLIELFGGALLADSTYSMGNYWWYNGSTSPNSTWNLGFAGIGYTGNIADMIDIKAEYSWIFGDMKWNQYIGAPRSASVEGWNLYLDASYHNDLLRVGLAFVMGSGAKHWWGGASMHNINMTYLRQDDFTFANIIANGYGGLNSVYRTTNKYTPGFGNNAENLTAIKLYFEVTPTEKLTLNAAVIWAKWTDPVGNGPNVAADAPAYPHPVYPYSHRVYNSWELSSDLGWEIDFGLKYQIMEGLSYTLAAGVLLPGASFDYINANGTRESWGPIWSVSNTLQYEF